MPPSLLVGVQVLPTHRTTGPRDGGFRYANGPLLNFTYRLEALNGRRGMDRHFGADERFMLDGACAGQIEA